VAPDPGSLAALAAAVGAGAAVAVPALDRPLPLAVGPEGAGALRQAFDDGERAVHRAVAAVVGVVVVPIEGFADADTPDQLPPGAR
jgi:hypothetical protein